MNHECMVHTLLGLFRLTIPANAPIVGVAAVCCIATQSRAQALQTHSSSCSVRSGFCSPLHKILMEPGSDATQPGRPRLPVLQPTYDLVAGRNEFESVQLVVVNGPKPLENVTVTCNEPRAVSTRRKVVFGIEVFREHYVFVSKPSGNAIDRPMWYPDALMPLRVQPYRDMGANETCVYWLTFYIPPSAPPGKFTGKVSVWDAGERFHAVHPYSITVENYTIPERRRFCATGALYYDIVRDYHNKHFREGLPPLQRESPEWVELQKTYYEFLLQYRFVAYDLPVPLDSPEALRYLDDPRVPCVRLPWLLDSDQAIRAAVHLLEQSGHLSKAFSYQADEPALPKYPDVIRLAQGLRAAHPAIRHLVTVSPCLPLYGYVDIWCPNIGDALNLGVMDLPRLQMRRKLGEETWWYTMTVPRYPYPTWLIDDDAVAPRIFMWMSSLYGFTGCVYSMVHGWSENPFENVESYLNSNGDGLLFYPGEKFGTHEPFPSIRLQLLRDGLEDYEMLAQLPASVRMTACRALIQDFTRFSRTPETLESVRRWVIRVITGKTRIPPLRNYRQPAWPSPKVTTIVTRVAAPPTVDGVISKEEWASNRWLTSFWKANGMRRARATSRAQVLYDADHLYVAAECNVPGTAGSDPSALQWFAISIDPGRKRHRYYLLLVTAKGNCHAALRSRDGVDSTWEPGWEFQSHHSPKGFTVEMRIPFKGLKRSPQQGEVWGFNLLRRSREEFSAWQANYGNITLMPGMRFE